MTQNNPDIPERSTLTDKDSKIIETARKIRKLLYGYAHVCGEGCQLCNLHNAACGVLNVYDEIEND